MKELIERIEASKLHQEDVVALARELGDVYTPEQFKGAVTLKYMGPKYASWATGQILRNLVNEAMIAWDNGLDSRRPLGNNERRCRCGAIIWLDPDFGIESHSCN